MKLITEKDIQKIARKIVEGVHPEKIIVFGSVVRQESTRDSDLDLLVVLDTELPYLDRYALVRGLIRLVDFPIDLLVFTPSEVNRQLTWTNSIIREAIEEGRVVYERING